VDWTCTVPGGNRQAHAALVAADLGGVRQYVNHLTRTLVGVSATDGKLLWTFDGLKVQTAVTHVPLVSGDTVFYASGYGVGDVLLRLKQTGDVCAPEEVYRGAAKDYPSLLGSLSQVGGHVFVN